MAHRLSNLDLLRGLAALAVCAGHLRAFLFIDFGQVANPGILTRAFYFATGLGHQAVIVFFVLSGYLVGGSVLSAYQSGRWSWKTYALRRMTRLWIVLLPALALTLALDGLGLSLGYRGYDGAFNSLYNSGPAADAPADLRATTLLGNILFLQTIQVPCLGTNGPLWSLSNEFWYYVLFPLLCGICFMVPGPWSVERALRCALSVFLAIGLLCWLPSKILASGLVWLLGVAAFWVGRLARARRICGHPAWIFGAGLLAMGSLLASKVHPILGSDLVVGLAFTMWVVGLASSEHQVAWLRRASTALSEMSYTLYLVHFPSLAFVFFVAFKGAQWAPQPTGYLIFLAMLVGTIAFAGILWWLFERNTEWVRRTIEPLLFQPDSRLMAGKRLRA